MKKQRHPFPQMSRKRYRLLDGEWKFKADKENCGEAENWFEGLETEEKILVPFACESVRSGIGCECAPRNIWYEKMLFLSEEEISESVLLWFEGVDYTAKIWINGHFIGIHDGAYTAFSFDIMPYAREGENLLVVKAEDGYRLENPRGKQRWLNKSYSCWYVPTTGIWKSVFLEFTGNIRFEKIKWTPDINTQTLKAELFLNDYRCGLSVILSIFREGREEKFLKSAIGSTYHCITIDLGDAEEEFQVKHWSAETPALYDVKVVLEMDRKPKDEIESYFGFREFCSAKGALTINGTPIYQKLVLYQGYWKDTGLTPPSDEAIEKDLKDIKRMGFNGIRVHQKIESEYFLSCADRLGLYVWCEMPSAHAFNDDMKNKLIAEWSEIVRQKYNHPSIVVWVPFNESWGIRGVRRNKEMQDFADAAYYLTKAYDSMRPVVTNDGWEHVKTDIVTVHNYEQNPERLNRAYCSRESAMSEGNAVRHQKFVFSEGYRYDGQPVIISEYGGIAFMNGLSGDDWGYSAVATEDDFCARFQALCDAIKRIGYVYGYCYTQFSDVWQEKNGLVTMDRKYKVDPAKICKINAEFPAEDIK